MVPDDERRSSAICGEILCALERARTQLAVAAAAEAKTTTMESRLRYVLTEERVRRSVKRLRRGIALQAARLPVWTLALSELERFPPHFEAGRESRSQWMCRRLLEVVATIEPDLLPEEVQRHPEMR
jgi:hypothetical protein